jgi:head-tail adaptor
MTIGALHRSFTLQKESVTNDGTKITTGWSDVAELWASLEPLAREPVTASFQKRMTHKVIMRVRDDIAIATGMRLVSGARCFLIRHIMNQDERDRFLELYVEEGGLLGA